MALHECRMEGVIETLQSEEKVIRAKHDALSSTVTTLQNDLKHGLEDHDRIREEHERFCRERFKSVEDFVWGDVKAATQWTMQFRTNFRQIVMALVIAALTAFGGLLIQFLTLRQQIEALKQQPPALQREVKTP